MPLIRSTDPLLGTAVTAYGVALASRAGGAALTRYPYTQSRVSCETTIDVGESITQHNTLF